MVSHRVHPLAFGNVIKERSYRIYVPQYSKYQSIKKLKLNRFSGSDCLCLLYHKWRDYNLQKLTANPWCWVIIACTVVIVYVFHTFSAFFKLWVYKSRLILETSVVKCDYTDHYWVTLRKHDCLITELCGAMWMSLSSFKLLFVLIQTVLLCSVGLRLTPTNGSCNIKGRCVPYPQNYTFCPIFVGPWLKVNHKTCLAQHWHCLSQ